MFSAIDILFLVSILFSNRTESETVEFKRNISAPSRQVCEDLVPPDPPGCVEDDAEYYFVMTAQWVSQKEVVVHVLNINPAEITIKGFILQARINGAPDGTMSMPVPGYFVLDCPPGKQVNITVI